MRTSVAAAWPAICSEHEGRLDWLYLDTRGLVTTGIGFLMDDGTGTAPEACLSLGWTDQGRPATRAQIASAWRVVKARTDLAPRGGFAFRDVTSLRLPGQVIDALLRAKTLEFWSVLAAQLVNLETWPADAQLALLDMAWQLGPRFLGSKWPNFTAAAHASDFARCSEHCSVRQASAGRNGDRIRWFRNAAQVVELDSARGVLWDTETPTKEDDDMAMTPEERQALIDDIAEEVIQRLPRFPSAAEIARKVLTLDGEIDNVGIHRTGGDYVTLATAVEFIAERVQS